MKISSAVPRLVPFFSAAAAFAAAPLVNPTPNPLTDIEPIFSRLSNQATGLAGLAIFVMLLVGAFRLLTSGSNQEKTQAAKNTITAVFWGGAGLILIWFILQFIEKFTGVNITLFEICITGRDAATGLCQ